MKISLPETPLAAHASAARTDSVPGENQPRAQGEKSLADRVTLRSMRQSDVPLLNEQIAADTKSRKYIFPDGRIDGLMNDSLHDADTHATVVELDGRPSGIVSSRKLGADVHTLAYWVSPEARGNGLASYAVSKKSEDLLRNKDVDAVYLTIKDDNVASQRLAQKLGYVHDDTNGDEQIWALERD